MKFLILKIQSDLQVVNDKLLWEFWLEDVENAAMDQE